MQHTMSQCGISIHTIAHLIVTWVHGPQELGFFRVVTPLAFSVAVVFYLQLLL